MTLENTPESATLDPDMAVVEPQTKTTEPLPEPEAKDAPPAKVDEKKPSRREQIEASLEKLEKGDPKDDPKAKDAPKDEGKAKEPPKPEPVKAADAPKPDADTQDADAKASEGKDKGKHPEPPARFTDDAKTVWRHTPREVKAEVYRVVQEYEAATAEFKEAKEFADEVKPYRDMAKQANTTVKAALDRYVEFDKQIYADFGKGVAAIAKDQGKQPAEAIASVLRAYGITPQQYAQHVTQNPQAHQVQQPAQRDPALQQVLQTQQQIIQRLQEQDREKVMTSLDQQVNTWAADKPDYSALEQAIAEILKSGIVERIHGQGLSVEQRLSVAYKMAGGNAKQLDPEAPPTSPEREAIERSPSADAGKLSIKGAISGGKEPSIPRKPQSRRASIEAALAKLQAQ